MVDIFFPFCFQESTLPALPKSAFKERPREAEEEAARAESCIHVWSSGRWDWGVEQGQNHPPGYIRHSWQAGPGFRRSVVLLWYPTSRLAHVMWFGAVDLSFIASTSEYCKRTFLLYLPSRIPLLHSPEPQSHIVPSSARTQQGDRKQACVRHQSACTLREDFRPLELLRTHILFLRSCPV